MEAIYFLLFSVLIGLANGLAVLHLVEFIPTRFWGLFIRQQISVEYIEVDGTKHFKRVKRGESEEGDNLIKLANKYERVKGKGLKIPFVLWVVVVDLLVLLQQ